MYLRMTGVSAAAFLALTACSKAPAVAQADSATQVAAAAPVQATPMVDGKAMWSSTKTYTAQENAARAFASNGASFSASNVDAYVKLAHAFVDRPPSTAQTLKRANGDTLIYDAQSNTFAVMTTDGVPRTMFKPSTGAAYWAQQVASGGETRSTTAATKTATDSAA